jgi:6-phosphogluconolactonase (cycloisomerase 2 family)
MRNATSKKSGHPVHVQRVRARPRTAAWLAGMLCTLLVACGGGGGGGGGAGSGGVVGGVAVKLEVTSSYEGVTFYAGANYNDGSGDATGEGGSSGGAAGGDGGDSGGAGAGGGLGAFVNAVITVVRADGTVVGSAPTDAYGMVSIKNGGDKQPLLITAQGAANATYWDEALQKQVPFPATQTLHVMVAATGTGQTLSKNVGITPLTEAAYQYAVTNLGGVNAWKSAANINAANQAVMAEFNRFVPSTMQIDDITRLPALAHDATTQVFGTVSKNVTYGLINSGLVRAAIRRNPGSTAPGIDLLRQITLDLSDGKLDAVGPGNVPVAPASQQAYLPASLNADLLAGIQEMAQINGKALPVTPYTLGGSVSGLSAGGLVLASGGAQLGVPAGATSFSLGRVLVAGSSYDVTVQSQPAGQTCTVSAGAGTATGDVTNVSVACVSPPPPMFSVGGTVSGLVGSGLVLQNNGADNLTGSADGSFTFSTAIASGSAYGVTVFAQPSNPAQICTVSNGSGVVTGAVGNVAVTCTTLAPSTFSIGVTVSGLAGTGLVLQNNGGNDLPITANGNATFTTPIVSGSRYAVTVLKQPGSPVQTCVVGNGTGTATANVTNVTVTCTTVVFSVGGSVSGLAGSGLVLQNNGTDSLAVSANGSFTFGTTLPSGSPYGVTVLTQPSNQICLVGNGAGSVTANVSNVAVTCTTIPPSQFTLGGTVSGLAGTGLTLQKNGGENLSVGANGNFTFATPVVSGTNYAVTVLTQPGSPAQTCVVGNGSGTAAANVTNISVTCTTTEFNVGGTVTGLAGSGLVLQISGGNNLALGANGSFTFATAIPSGNIYSVTVLTQPSNPTQVCTVSNGTGIVTAPVANVAVSCTTPPPPTFTIGGTVSGLAGSGLVLQNNGGNNLAVGVNGSFTFTTALPSASSYAVTVLTQPGSPAQTCAVGNGTGTATANVTNVTVTCTTATYSIGGTVSGLSGTGLVLQNNGGNNLAVGANGSFTFGAAVADGNTYGVTVLSQPTNPAQTCAVGNATGTATANVTNIGVTCTTNPPTTVSIGGTVSGLAGSGLVLQNNGGSNLPISANGSFTFAVPVVLGSPYAVTVLAQPANPTQSCVVGNGTGTAAAPVTNITVTCTTTTFSVGGTVAGLAGAGLVLQNNGGNNLAVGANGNVTFSAPVASGSSYNVTVLAQPTNPLQTCSVANGSGTVGATSVVTVAVSCTNQSVRYAYVANNAANNVSTFVVDASTGRLKFIRKVAAGSAPSAVAVDPSQRFAYVANQGDGTVSQYTIGADGSLTPMTPAAVAAGSAPNGVTIDPSGKFAYVANYVYGGTVSQYSIGANGGLQPIPGAPTVAAGEYAIAVSVHPSGKYAYVVNNGTTDTNGGISQYTIGADGALTPNGAAVPAGTNPSVLSLDPTGRYAYAANWNSANVSQYTVGADGRLAPMSPSTVATGSTPNGVAVDPSGRFVYTSNWGSGNVSQFTVGVNGSLTPIADAPVAEVGPAAIKVDPSGKFVYLANVVSNSVSQYTIGANGSLTANAPARVAAQGAPAALAFSYGANPSAAVPRFAYVANLNTNNVSQYTIRADGGLTPMTPATVSTGSSPYSVSVDPSGRFAYVANYGSNNISQFTIGPGGNLTPMAKATVPAGLGATSVAVDPSGRFVYAANYGDSSVSQYALGVDGSLTAIGYPVLTGLNPNAVSVDPSGRYVYTANFSSNTISQYTIAADGSLTPMTPAIVAAGAYPYTVSVEPSGRYAYAPNFNTGTAGSVLQYSVGSNGNLTPMAPAAVTAGINAYAIGFDPIGKFAYVANLDGNDVSQYTIGASGGLTPMTPATVASPTRPSAVSIDPSGKFAYVTNCNSNTVSIYTIGANGSLTLSGTIGTGTYPEFIITIGTWQ